MFYDNAQIHYVSMFCFKYQTWMIYLCTYSTYARCCRELTHLSLTSNEYNWQMIVLKF